MLSHLPVEGARHKARQTGRTAGTAQASLWSLLASLAGSQVERGGRVLFEHPEPATLWNESCLKKWLAINVGSE